MRTGGFPSNPLFYSQLKSVQFHKPNTARALANQLLHGPDFLKDASFVEGKKSLKAVRKISNTVQKNSFPNIPNYKMDSLMNKDSRDYNNQALRLFNSANLLSRTNKKSVFNETGIESSNPQIAEITALKEGRRGNRGFELEVHSLAGRQVSGFEEVKSSDISDTVESGFKLRSSGKEYEIRVKGKTEQNQKPKTNHDILNELADKVNNLKTAVRAKVEKNNENSILKLSSKETGSDKAFRITEGVGLTGKHKVLQTAKDAVYQIHDKGFSKEYKSSDNDINLNYYGVKAELKEVGKTSIRFEGADKKKILNSVEEMLRDYNRLSELEKKKDKSDREKSLLISEQNRDALQKIGIDYNKTTDKFSINKKRHQLALDRNLDDIKRAITGSKGLASQIKQHAHEGFGRNMKATLSNQFHKSLEIKTAHNKGVNQSWSNNQPVLPQRNLYGFDRAFHYGLSFDDGFL